MDPLELPTREDEPTTTGSPEPDDESADPTDSSDTSDGSSARDDSGRRDRPRVADETRRYIGFFARSLGSVRDWVLELNGGATMAIASIHFVTDSHIAAGHHERLKEEWSRQVAHELTSYFAADSYVIAGDFNIKRCPNPIATGQSAPGDPSKEDYICRPRAWWRALNTVYPHPFADRIYEEHGDPTRGNSQQDLERQYQDGTEERPKRIDFIFSAASNDPPWASHDLTCGLSAPDNQRNSCQDPLNPDYYSDHRLLWSLIGS